MKFNILVQVEAEDVVEALQKKNEGAVLSVNPIRTDTQGGATLTGRQMPGPTVQAKPA